MVDRNDVRRGYEAVAESYATERSAADEEMEVLEAFLRRLPGSARVLDAGCGQGKPVLCRLTDPADAVGLDFSREQLRLAAGNAPGASLVRGDITDLPFRDGAFDAVTAFHSLIHVPADEHQQVVEEFARVLGPEGRVLLSEGVGEWSGTNPDWLGSGAEMQWHIAGTEATRNHLRAAGFAVVEEWTTGDELADDEGRWRFFAAGLDP